jgi:hypothetical protein
MLRSDAIQFTFVAMLMRNGIPRRCRKKPKARARKRRLLQAIRPEQGIFPVAQLLTSQTSGNREANAGLLGRLDGADRPAIHSEA